MQALAQESTLCVCFLAAWLLRAPVTAGDLITWAFTGQLPYLDLLAHVPAIRLRVEDVQKFRPSGAAGKVLVFRAGQFSSFGHIGPRVGVARPRPGAALQSTAGAKP